MKKQYSIKSRLTLWFIFIIIIIMALSWITIPVYYDYIVQENFFETIEKKPDFNEQTPPTSDMYAVQRLLIDSEGKILTRREDIFSLRFFSEEFLGTLSDRALRQEEQAKRYVIPLEDVNVYAVIEKYGEIYHVKYMYDIYGKDFAERMVQSNMLLLLFLAITGSLVMFYFSKKLVNRILRMRSRVKSITEGHWHFPIPVSKDDELGDLEYSFEQMRLQLIEQDQFKNDMFQNISHELKTPIMVINTYAQGVKDNIYPEGDLTRTIDVILDESMKLENKVQRILYLNKLQFLKERNEPLVPVKLEPIIRDLCNRFQNLRKIDFKLDMDSETEFMGDEEKWRIAIENILSNNLRYADSVIEIKLKQNSLVIYNDGPPIEFENPNEVFLAFRKGKAGHNGIGLEITHSIINLFHYSIQAVNMQKGVAFMIKGNSANENETANNN